MPLINFIFFRNHRVKFVKLLTIENCHWNSFTMPIHQCKSKFTFFCINLGNPVQVFHLFCTVFENRYSLKINKEFEKVFFMKVLAFENPYNFRVLSKI